MVHAPMLARNPKTELVGVWARRETAAQSLAAQHGTTPYLSFDHLTDECDALAFCVPPPVQADLAARAARRGRSLLLEKPIGLNLSEAERLAEVVNESGVVTQLVLTWRFADSVRDLLMNVKSIVPIGARATFVNGMLLGGMFATPWRLKQGPLLDLGPHLLDLLEACLGPIEAVTARGDPHGWISLILEHQGGLISEATICGISQLEPENARGSRSTREMLSSSSTPPRLTSTEQWIGSWTSSSSASKWVSHTNWMWSTDSTCSEFSLMLPSSSRINREVYG